MIFGLGNKITAEDSEIIGARLPTNEQVLRCIRYHLNDGGTCENRTRWESAKLVLAKIAVFYEKANIPMISDRKACEKMIQLLHDNDKIRAIPSKRRSTAATMKKVSEMKEKLAKTFQLWPQNAEKMIKMIRGIYLTYSNLTAHFSTRPYLIGRTVKNIWRQSQTSNLSM